MKRAWLVFGCLLACSAISGERLPKSWLERYVAVQEALAADNFMGSKKALENLAMYSEGEIRKMADRASRCPDLTKMRLSFKPISEALQQSELPGGYVEAFCPMAFDNKGGYWVQRQGIIRNPYFGAYMLHCGSITRVGSDN